MAGEAYLRTFERALLARGVPFAYAGGEYLAPSLEESQWVICATAGGVKGEVFEKLRAAQKKGVRVTIGPRVPARDGSMRSMSRPHDVTGLEVEPLLDAADADALVARRIAELGLETYPVHPANVFSVVHEDEAGHPKAVFVMNPSATEAEAQVSLPGVGALEDLLRGGKTTRTGSAFEMVIPARTVRFFAVDGLAPRSVPPPSNRRGSEAPPSSKGRNSRRR
jgi:beta-galactosidase